MRSVIAWGRLQQQVALLGELQARIAEDEKLLRQMHDEHPLLGHILSLPGMGPILGAVVINEIDDISRFGSAQKFCGYAGLCPTTSSSGGKTYNGKLFKHCNKWLRWAFIEAAGGSRFESMAPWVPFTSASEPSAKDLLWPFFAWPGVWHASAGSS